MVVHSKTARKAKRHSLVQRPHWSAVLVVAIFALTGSVFLWRSFAANANLPGDVNNDNKVNLTDLSQLLSKWNSTDSNADVSGDGKVNLQDLSILLTNWNKTYTPTTPPPPTPPVADYIENEQFNGASLSGTKWVAKTYKKGYRNSEEQDYRPSQAKVENGNLVITAVKDSSGWHSAEVESTWRLNHGSFEVRMRTSASATGMWPAAWLLSDSWPGDGEIDIMEAVDDDPTVWGSLHGGPSHWNLYKTHTPVDVSQWHTYRMDITTNNIVWFVDGVERGRFNKSQVPSGGTWPFDSKTYYGILNLAMGGTWPKDTNSSTPNPLMLYVDYFTVKKL